MWAFIDRIQALKKKVETERIKQRSWEVERRRLLLSVEDKRELSTILLQVVEVYKQLGGDSEEQILSNIQTFVSYGLSAVFGEDYSFVTLLSKEGKDLKVDFQVHTMGIQSKVIGARGGGVAEVVSILMQIFFVLMNKDLSRFIVLDAALLHLSPKYWRNMSQLLSELCHKSDIQILLMAHAGDYGVYADSLYKFTQREGKTISEKIK